MTASHLEKWSARALIAVFGSQSDIPDELAEAARTSNTAAMAQMGLKCLSGLSWEKIEPLYDELLGQIDRVPDPAKPEAVIKLNTHNGDAHVASAGTLWRLRVEVVALCLNFSTDGVRWESLPGRLFSPQGSPDTPTCPPSSAA